MTAYPLAHEGSRWSWYLGDLPPGSHFVVGLRVHHIRQKPRQGYILDVNWYAVSSPGQPRNTWHHLVGENTAEG
jgi:hypothetical protein